MCRLLIGDNFGAHITEAALDAMIAAGTDFIGLPPHSSHATQALDSSPNQSFKHNMHVVESTEESWDENGLLVDSAKRQRMVALIALPQGDRMYR